VQANILKFIRQTLGGFIRHSSAGLSAMILADGLTTIPAGKERNRITSDATNMARIMVG